MKKRKPGRPSRMGAAASKTVGVRLAPNELYIVRHHAKQAGVPPAAWLRNAALVIAMTSYPHLEEALAGWRRKYTPEEVAKLEAALRRRYVRSDAPADVLYKVIGALPHGVFGDLW